MAYDVEVATDEQPTAASVAAVLAALGPPTPTPYAYRRPYISRNPA